MKKLFSLLMVLSLVSPAYAYEGEQLTLFPDLEYKELLKKVEEACEDMGNGGCYNRTYDVAQFNYQATLKKLADQYYDAERDYQYLAITDVKEILNDYYLKRVGLTDILKELLRTNKVKALMQFIPDGEICNESEYCSISNIYVFLNDGQHIHMEFDFTD